MPASARPRMRHMRLSSATTRCCSTPRSPRRPIPSRWRALSGKPSRPDASRMRPGGCKPAMLLLPPRQSSGPRSGMLYPDRYAYPDRFYPVVDSVAWVARLAALGVGTIHFRVKDLDDYRALQLVSD